MSVSLTKLINGKPAISDTLLNEQVVKCPLCEQTYRFGYSDGEWHRVKDWLTLAEQALRNGHDGNHEAASLSIAWKTFNRR